MTSNTLHDRLSIASRIIAAIFGGYALTSWLAIASALLLAKLGMNDAEAVLAATIAGFPVYAGIVMVVFHARTARRAWLGLMAASVPPALVFAVSGALTSS